MNLFKKARTKKENKTNSVMDIVLDEQNEVSPLVYMFMAR